MGHILKSAVIACQSDPLLHFESRRGMWTPHPVLNLNTNTFSLTFFVAQHLWDLAAEMPSSWDSDVPSCAIAPFHSSCYWPPATTWTKGCSFDSTRSGDICIFRRPRRALVRVKNAEEYILKFNARSRYGTTINEWQLRSLIQHRPT